MTAQRSFFLVDDKGILRQQWLNVGGDTVMPSEPILKAVQEIKGSRKGGPCPWGLAGFSRASSRLWPWWRRRRSASPPARSSGSVWRGILLTRGLQDSEARWSRAPCSRWRACGAVSSC
jgi:hypothetical protein